MEKPGLLSTFLWGKNSSILLILVCVCAVFWLSLFFTRSFKFQPHLVTWQNDFFEMSAIIIFDPYWLLSLGSCPAISLLLFFSTKPPTYRGGGFITAWLSVTEVMLWPSLIISVATHELRITMLDWLINFVELFFDLNYNKLLWYSFFSDPSNSWQWTIHLIFEAHLL